MNRKKSGKVTIANIVSLLGLVGLVFLVFCGHALQNPEENMGVNILVSVSLTAFVGFLLWLMVYAKGVENNFKGWLMVEVVAAVLFLGTAVFTGTKMMHFFVVAHNMEALKKSALNDIESIENIIQLFKEQEKSRLDTNKTGIINAKRARRCDASVKKWLKDNNISDSTSDSISVNQWYKLKTGEIDHIEYENRKYNGDWNKNIGEIRAVVESWNLLLLPDAASRITKMSEDVRRLLTTISERNDIVKIQSSADEFGYHSTYEVVESSPYKYKVTVLFPSEVRVKSGFSVMGLFLIILVNVLVLFSYIFAFRSNKVHPRNNRNNMGGIALH